MQAEYIEPFVKSITSTFQTVVHCTIVPDKPVSVERDQGRYQISGVIGISGHARGSVVVCLSKQTAIHAAAAMLMIDPEKIAGLTADVADAVGEIANIVAGSAKAEIQRYQLSIGLPSVMIGDPPDFRFPAELKPIAVPFRCPWGPMALQVGLSPLAIPAQFLASRRSFARLPSLAASSVAKLP